MAGAVARTRVLGAAAVLALCAPSSAHAADLAATPATLNSVWSSAQGGDRILLASGSYGEFTANGSKASTVTILPQSGATASISLQFSGASNVRVDGLTITDLEFQGSTRNVTVANSIFTGQAVIRTDQMVNANVVLDGNQHANINVGGCGNCYEGRIQIAGSGPGASGVVVKNSVIGPGGDADGIQINANGAQILGNEFVGIKQVSQVHTDSIQLYGAKNTVIRGNYFHDFDVALMAPDGGENEQVIDNVIISSGGYRPAVQMGGHRGSVFAHNVTRNIDVYMDAKSGELAGQDNVVRDNVVMAGTVESPTSKCNPCSVSHNLFTSGSSSKGANAVVGTPLFAGGSSPTAWAGYVLAMGSLGKGTASDGADRGIRADAVSGPPAPTPPPAPADPPAPARTVEGLVAAYGFNETSGTRATDSSGGGHHARLRGARRTRTAHSGMALFFNGRASLSIPRSVIRGLRSFTLAAWTRPSTSARRRVLNAPGQAAPKLRSRRWSHLAVTYNGSRVRVYVNGKLVSSRRAKARLGSLALGRGFKGRLDDVRIYRRALAGSDLRADMSSSL